MPEMCLRYAYYFSLFYIQGDPNKIIIRVIEFYVASTHKIQLPIIILYGSPCSLCEQHTTPLFYLEKRGSVYA